jgi:hypothetical protein
MNLRATNEYSIAALGYDTALPFFGERGATALKSSQ